MVDFMRVDCSFPLQGLAPAASLLKEECGVPLKQNIM
jgi:hypothetical protein